MVHDLGPERRFRNGRYIPLLYQFIQVLRISAQIDVEPIYGLRQGICSSVMVASR